MVASASYRELLREAHEKFPRWGHGHADLHLQTVLAMKPASVLDFGCGKGGLVRALQAAGVDAAGFDPGVAEFELFPERHFDLVTCLDVLEHVEPEHLVSTMERLVTAGDRAYAVISTVPAKKLLPNGQNAHLIVQPARTWVSLIQAMCRVHLAIENTARNELHVWF